MTCEQQIRFTAALHRGRLSVAEEAIDNLASVAALEAAYWWVVVIVVVMAEAAEMSTNCLIVFIIFTACWSRF